MDTVVEDSGARRSVRLRRCLLVNSSGRFLCSEYVQCHPINILNNRTPTLCCCAAADGKLVSAVRTSCTLYFFSVALVLGIQDSLNRFPSCVPCCDVCVCVSVCGFSLRATKPISCSRTACASCRRRSTGSCLRIAASFVGYQLRE